MSRWGPQSGVRRASSQGKAEAADAGSADSERGASDSKNESRNTRVGASCVPGAVPRLHP